MIDHIVEISWHSPLEAAQSLLSQGEETALLYSAEKTSYSGEYSYLAWGVVDELTANNISEISTTNEATVLPQWFGYIKYEANHRGFGLPHNNQEATICFVKYANVLRYNHISEKCYYQGIGAAPEPTTLIGVFPKAKYVNPSFSRSEYLQKAQSTIEQINAGNFYQANLTCKYVGKLEEKLTAVTAFAGFIELCKTSPAPYSAFIANKDSYIISASPELFVKIDAEQNISTRPIKGTAPINETADSLRLSEKNMAENLMIVDLMRNDLSQCAINGTVKVPHLWEVDSFKNLHHLSSTISAKLHDDFQLHDVLEKIFPAGSMTGAPKLAAMQWLIQNEGINRGIYSGALGWINGKECELSVIIRTLIASGDNFECQFGGGIVADSNPESEYQEMMTKGNSIFNLLGC